MFQPPAFQHNAFQIGGAGGAVAAFYFMQPNAFQVAQYVAQAAGIGVRYEGRRALDIERDDEEVLLAVAALLRSM